MEFLKTVNQYWGIIYGGAMLVLLLLMQRFVSHGKCKECRLELIEEQKRIKADQKDMAKQQHAQALVLAKLTTSIEALPTAKDIQDLRAEHEKTNKSLSRMEGELGGMKTTLDRLERVHISHG